MSSGCICGCSPLVDQVENCRTAGFPVVIRVVVTRTRLHKKKCTLHVFLAKKLNKADISLNLMMKLLLKLLHQHCWA